MHGSAWDTAISGCVLIHAPAKPQTHHYLMFILSRHFFFSLEYIYLKKETRYFYHSCKFMSF